MSRERERGAPVLLLRKVIITCYTGAAAAAMTTRVHVTRHAARVTGMVDEVMVVGTGGRRVLIWDIRNMKFEAQRRCVNFFWTFAPLHVLLRKVIITCLRYRFTNNFQLKSTHFNLINVPRRESALKFMTRCIRCFPNKKGKSLLWQLHTPCHDKYAC